MYLFIAFLFSLSFTDCAKKGFPSGGKLDSIPPVLLRSTPENYTTNFNGNEIRITFDEYIKLKDLSKNLLISPPATYAPIITPLSTSKTLKIQIQDTLKENTTYSYNFGKSIVDNNEENPFEYYKYVFSTGDYIDSLTLSGTVKDAELLTPSFPATVLLYEINEVFKDSLIYTEKPTYITTTTDSIGSFELTNLKEGSYLLLALKDKGNDYLFQPKVDKIAFEKTYVTLPTDTTYTLNLFKESADYRVINPKHESKNHILFGYEGNADSLTIEVISEVPSGYTSRLFKDRSTDTLHYWFKPSVEVDSLLFLAKNRGKTDTLKARIRDLYVDTLNIKNVSPQVLTPKDSVILAANTPLTSFASELITVTDKDTVAVEASVKINRTNNTLAVFFPKLESQSYTMNVLPGAITDFFETTNDTLKYTFRTQALSDYGTLSLTLSNAREFPLIVQLVDAKFKVVSEKLVTENTVVDFDYLKPASYYLRIIYDTNANGIWDTGSFLDRRAPERVVYYPSQLEVRSNWSLQETFTLE
ncbi:hypothetical protein ULVI_04775 [Cochleicola gelatinilyticus]|uniref:SbsA Ig-like domain-containing protein n=1 Tax=Cochleicola gelatinilyticus TaxID=1763537 RepID=A0A167IVG2_9FLAO|nr:hypothetical protein ULVI_04775 [Cochleicola gelatinilyticus]